MNGTKSAALSERSPQETAVARIGRRLRGLQPGALLSGLYAWLATVALPIFRGGASVACQVAAATAPGLLIAGVAVARRWPSVGRLLGIWGFVGVATLAWILAGPRLAVSTLEPARSALGMLGWAMFAFGWGTLRRGDRVPEEDPHALAGQRLSPRGTLGGYPSLVFLMACVLAVLPAFGAWSVVRPPHALLAHAVAVACAVAMIAAGASIAVGRGQWVAPTSQKRRLGVASGALSAVAVLVVIGAVLSLL